MKRFGRVCATTVTWLPKKMGFLGDFYRIYVKISKPKSQWTIVKMLLNPCLWVSFASVCLHIKDNHWCSILLNENVGDACCSPKKVSEFEFFFWILNHQICMFAQTDKIWLCDFESFSFSVRTVPKVNFESKRMLHGKAYVATALSHGRCHELPRFSRCNIEVMSTAPVASATVPVVR